MLDNEIKITLIMLEMYLNIYHSAVFRLCPTQYTVNVLMEGNIWSNIFTRLFVDKLHPLHRVCCKFKNSPAMFYSSYII